MSVKFKEEITRTTTSASKAGEKGDVLHEVGNALTKASGPEGYLGVCIY